MSIELRWRAAGGRAVEPLPGRPAGDLPRGLRAGRRQARPGHVNSARLPGASGRRRQPAEPSTSAQPGAILPRDMEFRGKRLHMLTGGPEGAQAVLLLHGAVLHPATWQELGTLDLPRRPRPARGGHRPAGLRPVRGNRPAAEEFLAAALPALGVARPILVSPSMSGAYSFPLLEEHPELLAGFVGVAPGGRAAVGAQAAGQPGAGARGVGDGGPRVSGGQAKTLATCFKVSTELYLEGASIRLIWMAGCLARGAGGVHYESVGR